MSLMAGNVKTFWSDGRGETCLYFSIVLWLWPGTYLGHKPAHLGILLDYN